MGERRQHRPQHGEPDGALLRLPVGDAHWAEVVPPVPGGHRVTVTFSDADCEAEHAEALALLGYRVLGVAAAPVPAESSADFLAREELLASHPTWARAMAQLATRTWRLEFGPVRVLLGRTLAIHGPPR